MPHACRVEPHAYCYLAEKREPTGQARGIQLSRVIEHVAANVKYHGTSPWHLSTFEAKPASKLRRFRRGWRRSGAW